MVSVEKTRIINRKIRERPSNLTTEIQIRPHDLHLEKNLLVLFANTKGKDQSFFGLSIFASTY